MSTDRARGSIFLKISTDDEEIKFCCNPTSRSTCLLDRIVDHVQGAMTLTRINLSIVKLVDIHEPLTQPSTAIFKGGIESSDRPVSNKLKLGMAPIVRAESTLECKMIFVIY